jgi:hypothetical protein
VEASLRLLRSRRARPDTARQVPDKAFLARAVTRAKTLSVRDTHQESLHLTPIAAWSPETLANAIDRVFSHVDEISVADMLAAAHHCQATLAPTGKLFAVDECMRKWAVDRGIHFYATKESFGLEPPALHRLKAEYPHR